MIAIEKKILIVSEQEEITLEEVLKETGIEPDGESDALFKTSPEDRCLSTFQLARKYGCGFVVFWDCDPEIEREVFTLISELDGCDAVCAVYARRPERKYRFDRMRTRALVGMQELVAA